MSDQSTSFRARVLKSGSLSMLRFGSDIGLRLISTVVLTRILSPDVYGVFAIVLVYLYLLDMFSDLGIRALILTKEGDIDDPFLWSCWTVSIARGLAILSVSGLIAVVIALLQVEGAFSEGSPYAAAALPWAIVALGATTLITGFQSPMRFINERAMRFERVTFVDVTRNIVALVVTIGLAIYLQSIWALVFGNIARAIAHLVLSFAVFPGPRMRLHLDRSHLKMLIGRGKWIIGHSMLTALARAADRLVLGFVMTSASFGFYFIARQLADMVAIFMEILNNQMGLQVFTHLQKSTPDAWRRNYYRYRLFFDALAGVSVGCMVMLAPLLVKIVFDDRYTDVGPMVQLLSLGILLTGPLLLRSAYYAERQFRLITMLGVVSTVVLWLSLTVSIFVFESVTLSLVFIALYRLPEAMIFIILAWRRGWVVVWRETLGLMFCGLGLFVGWGILILWNSLT